jgi:hypothetical protein
MPTGPYSSWPRKKNYSGVFVLNHLDPKKIDDQEKINNYIKLAREKKDWFKPYPGKKEDDFEQIYINTEFAEVMMPNGTKEILAFDNFDSTDAEEEGEGIISAQSLDGKWEFWVPVKDWGGEINWQELDFQKIL